MEIPDGWKKTTALIRNEIPKRKAKGAKRQKKCEQAKRDAGFVRAWIPISIVEIADAQGWDVLALQLQQRTSSCSKVKKLIVYFTKKFLGYCGDLIKPRIRAK